MVHPGYFVSALVSSAVIKLSADSVQQNSVLQHIDLVAEHFRIVTSNLMNQYQEASQIVATSFTLKNPKAVHKAIDALIEGHNKSNNGTLQKFFDQRDLELEKIKMEELKLSGMHQEQNKDEWVNIEREDNE